MLIWTYNHGLIPYYQLYVQGLTQGCLKGGIMPSTKEITIQWRALSSLWTTGAIQEKIINTKVPLWPKLHHLFYQSHFKTKTSSLHDKKNAVYYFQSSLFVLEIFKFLK